jgi:hypothetical protein
MRSDAPLTPWPRLGQAWWVYGLAGGLVGLYSLGLVLRLRCGLGRCGGTTARLFDLDAVGGVPRLVITALFVATAVLAWRAGRAHADRESRWWFLVCAIAALLAAAKLVSVHSVAKGDSAVLTLVGSAGITVLSLVALAVLGRRWGVAAAGPVVLAMALYAGAAIGLDQVTSVLSALQSHTGALTAAAADFVEELGEALSVLILLVTVRWQAARVPGPRAPGPAGRSPAEAGGR